MAPEEDEDDIFGAEYDRREFREMCELFGFDDVLPPGTPEEPAAAPAPAPAAPPAPDDAAEISEEEARAYWAARDRAGGAATDEKALCRARARGAIAPVERTELGLAKDQRVVVLRAELAATGWVFAAAYDGASGYVPRSYLKPVSAAPTPAAEPGAARRAQAFADFEAEARARYLEEFSRLATTDDVIGYAWPKPELGPDGMPLPLATRGGAATAPVPERTADEEPALLGSHDRRRAHAETRRRALAARSRGVFRTGRSSHRGPLMPSIDKIKPLPPRPRDPFAPPRFAVTDVDGSRYELSSRAATSVSHQGGSDAEAAFAREVARDADVETFFDRSIVEAARARPMRGAPRGRQRYNSPYSRRVGPRLRPLEGGGTASVARALASTASAGARSVASALTVDDFSVASDQPIPYPPSLGRLDEREAQRLDAAVAAARSGTPPVVEARARTPQTPQGTVLVSQRRDDASSLGRIKAENLFGELCAAARTPSPNYLPVATLLEMADGDASELKDHPILRSIRAYPVIRKCASKYEPEDPRGLTFLEFDQLQSWFGELIHDYGLDLLPAADAPVAAPPMPASTPAEAAPALAEAPADPELWPDTPLVARSIDPNFRAGYPPRAELKSV